MKVLLDSDVLIEHFRHGRDDDALARLLSRSLLYMSSVVAMELSAGCRSDKDVRVLDGFLRPFERTGRTVHPDYSSWRRAGTSLVRLRQDFHLNAQKRRALANDLLIGWCAVQIGAVVVTNNLADFRLIQKVTPLRWAGTIQDALRL